MSDSLSAVSDIPTSMRPSQSVVICVKNTLQDLISSTFNKLTGQTKCVAENITEDICTKKECNSKIQSKENGVNSCEGPNISEPTSVSLMHRTKEAFNKRVKTFSLSLWCGKPLCLSPPILAQYGWKCIGEDVMKCCVCSAVVTVRLPWPNSSNYQLKCQSAQDKIKEGHGKICSWPSNPASDSLVQPFNLIYLTNKDKQKLITEFVDRVDHLYKLQKKLPCITSKTLSDLNLGSSELSKLLKHCHFTSLCDSVEVEADEQMRVAAMSLSLCGWDTSYTSDGQPPSIFCNETGRIAGLWNFYSVVSNEEGVASSPDAPDAKKRKIEPTTSLLSIEKSCFHPIHQHHIWSPWIVTLHPLSSCSTDASKQQSTRDDLQSGWEVLRQILLDYENDKENQDSEANVSLTTPNKMMSKSPLKTPPKIAVQQARKMFNEWSSI